MATRVNDRQHHPRVTFEPDDETRAPVEATTLVDVEGDPAMGGGRSIRTRSLSADELLGAILTELRIMNAHLATQTDERITTDDVERVQ